MMPFLKMTSNNILTTASDKIYQKNMHGRDGISKILSRKFNNAQKLH